jgi:hypothetical protein
MLPPIGCGYHESAVIEPGLAALNAVVGRANQFDPVAEPGDIRQPAGLPQDQVGMLPAVEARRERGHLLGGNFSAFIVLASAASSMQVGSDICDATLLDAGSRRS